MFQSMDVAAQTPDLAAELAAALRSQVEVMQFIVPCVEPGGLVIPDPELTTELVLPLIEDTMLDTLTIPTTYDYLPDLLCYALYGTHDLWPLMLRLNNAATRADFVGPTFTIVRQSSAGLLQAALKLAQQVQAQRSAGGPVAYGDLTVRQVPAP